MEITTPFGRLCWLVTQAGSKQTHPLVLCVRSWEIKQAAKFEVTSQSTVVLCSADSDQALQPSCPHEWTELAPEDVTGRPMCYKTETPVLTGLEKWVGPAMTILPSAGELQTGQDIGGSQSCCSRRHALHLPVERGRREWVGVSRRQQARQLQTQVRGAHPLRLT